MNSSPDTMGPTLPRDPVSTSTTSSPSASTVTLAPTAQIWWTPSAISMELPSFTPFSPGWLRDAGT